MKYLPRNELKREVREKIRRYQVTLILGPRQCGKTTLAKEVRKDLGGHYFDLEDPGTPLQPEIAQTVLEKLKGLIVIDEFQRQPGLFMLLRVLADRKPLPARFLVLGSASLDLIKGVSESLAGRVSYVEMGGFNLGEVGAARMETLWERGGFPQSFLAPNASRSLEWRADFLRSFLERDIPQLGIRVPAPALRRFWQMVAHYHGQIWNASDFARSLGVKEDTARKYLDILTGVFVLRQLPPWFENLGKRLVKSPKIYVRDSGILHQLLGLKDRIQIQSHPKLGFSWEGFALEQVITLLNSERESYFYKTYAGAELDLLVIKGGKRYGFEFKYADAPRLSKSMKVALDDLGLEKLWVVYPGPQAYRLGKKAEVFPLKDLKPDLI